MQKLRVLTAFLGAILLRDFLPSQIRTIVACVQGLIKGGQVSVTAIGRNIPGNALVKHKIKRVDRFLGNRLIDVDPLCSLMLLALARKCDRLLVSVDWTKIDNFQVLVFAVTTRHGRAVPVYWEVINQDEQRMKAVEIEAVDRFHALVPGHIKVTILADRGFDEVAFIRAVANHFEYVIRVAQGNSVSEAEKSDPDPAFVLLSNKLTVRDKAVDFGQVTFTRARRFETRVIGKHAQNKIDPWFLVTSRTDPTDAVVDMYARRFDIEHAFKDWKDVHNGWQLGAILSKSTVRLTRLLIIPALASLMLVLLGLFAESRNLHRQYQVNSKKNKRFMSLWRVGILLFNEPRLPSVTAEVLLRFLAGLALSWGIA